MNSIGGLQWWTLEVGPINWCDQYRSIGGIFGPTNWSFPIEKALPRPLIFFTHSTRIPYQITIKPSSRFILLRGIFVTNVFFFFPRQNRSRKFKSTALIFPLFPYKILHKLLLSHHIFPPLYISSLEFLNLLQSPFTIAHRENQISFFLPNTIYLSIDISPLYCLFE